VDLRALFASMGAVPPGLFALLPKHTHTSAKSPQERPSLQRNEPVYGLGISQVISQLLHSGYAVTEAWRNDHDTACGSYPQIFVHFEQGGVPVGLPPENLEQALSLISGLTGLGYIVTDSGDDAAFTSAVTLMGAHQVGKHPITHECAVDAVGVVTVFALPEHVKA
jgi:hypothetical protein